MICHFLIGLHIGHDRHRQVLVKCSIFHHDKGNSLKQIAQTLDMQMLDIKTNLNNHHTELHNRPGILEVEMRTYKLSVIKVLKTDFETLFSTHVPNMAS